MTAATGHSTCTLHQVVAAGCIDGRPLKHEESLKTSMSSHSLGLIPHCAFQHGGELDRPYLQVVCQILQERGLILIPFDLVLQVLMLLGIPAPSGKAVQRASLAEAAPPTATGCQPLTEKRIEQRWDSSDDLWGPATP